MARRISFSHLKNGFTIVELLIVIVVIGILAALVISTFASVQSRARDAKRSDDAVKILRALESYRAETGTYPQETPTGGAGSFEQSNDTPGTFMEYLNGKYFSTTPIDPVNDATHYYRYYVYPYSSLSSYGCPTDRGELMVFFVYGYENAQNVPQNDPPLVCTSRTWQGGGTTYFQYSFEKD